MSIALIVGLGNPGSRYAATRHNIGFWLVDQIASSTSSIQESFRAEAKFHGEISRVEISSGNLCRLLKPSTFMNKSGQAVAALANYYQIPTEKILVIHDDLDFPPGTVRLKKGGSDCKHNGLKDIISHLGSNQFMRLRFGIGHPGHRDDVIGYVLNAPTRDEQIEIEVAMTTALEVMPLIVAGEFNKAMQKLHTLT